MLSVLQSEIIKSGTEAELLHVWKVQYKLIRSCCSSTAAAQAQKQFSKLIQSCCICAAIRNHKKRDRGRAAACLKGTVQADPKLLQHKFHRQQHDVQQQTILLQTFRWAEASRRRIMTYASKQMTSNAIKITSRQCTRTKCIAHKKCTRTKLQKQEKVSNHEVRDEAFTVLKRNLFTVLKSCRLSDYMSWRLPARDTHVANQFTSARFNWRRNLHCGMKQWYLLNLGAKFQHWTMHADKIKDRLRSTFQKSLQKKQNIAECSLAEKLILISELHQPNRLPATGPQLVKY